MKIYHIEFAKIGHNLSGGEVCMIELIKYFKSLDYKNIILTTDNGEETYIKEIKQDKLVSYITVKAYKSEKRFGIIISYLIRTYRAIKLVRKLELKPDDLVICHSLFFPNSMPAWVLNKRHPSMSSVNFVHMLSPGLFRGYEGEFTHRHQIPKLAILNYQVNQWIYNRLTLQKTVIVTVNSYYLDYLEKKFPRNNIKVLKGYGAGIVPFKKQLQKQYDLVWVGRFHPQKGMQDLALVIKQIVEVKPDFKVVIVGDGSSKIKNNFMKQLKTWGLENNVQMVGFKTGEEKLNYYQQSRIFAMTSYYESFGQVILEAMGSGLPVVAYSLPVYEIFQDGIIPIPILNYKKMANQILVLLNDKAAYDEAKAKAQKVASKHSWPITAEEILESLA